MDYNIEWLYKIFTYSSIQVKFIATFVAILIFVLIRRFAIQLVHSQVKDTLSRYRWQKTITYIIFILAIFTVGRVWFKGIQSIATYLGLLSAGLAIALKDPITGVTGWAFILWRSPFGVGDRIQIGKIAGDVIDINFFKFTILEIGEWIDGDSNTGRIIHVPNGRVFTDDLANYGKGFKYIWNEIKVLVTFESNWKKAKKILKTIANDHSEYVTTEAAREYEKATQLFMIQKPNFKPEVYTKVEDSGVNLTIRYLCNPRKRRFTAQIIWEEVLNEFDKHDDIGFAYPTIRYYDER
tara:strand:- start:29 stop:913 length:885 start_codon:yes stop_codon:yes gene_type:complete